MRGPAPRPCWLLLGGLLAACAGRQSPAMELQIAAPKESIPTPTCAPGLMLVGRSCQPDLATNCPAGSHFDASRGCVAVGDFVEEPDPSELQAPIKVFYAQSGEFKEQYVIERIVAIRVRRAGSGARFVAHVHYRFRCVAASCCCGDIGEDKRTFQIDRHEGDWRVLSMGGHMSGQL